MPRRWTLEPDVLHNRRVALDPLGFKPRAEADRAGGQLLDAPGPGVPRDLVGDVGQVVEDVLGPPRDLDLVLDRHPATLAHLASTTPARGRRRALAGRPTRRTASRASTASPPNSPTAARARRDRRRSRSPPPRGSRPRT